MEPMSNERLEQTIASHANVEKGYTTRLTSQAEAAAMASELLNMRRRDEELGFAYDHGRAVIDICGTKFSRPVLEHFRVSSGADEYYQHARREDGVVILTRLVGLREQLRLLRECLAARPESEGVSLAQFEAMYLEWSAGVELLLRATIAEVNFEAQAVEDLIQHVRAFRESAQEEHFAADPTKAQAGQLEAGGRLFAMLERLDFARQRLVLWGLTLPQGYGTCAGCGCTDARACKDGCGWADDTHTLCTTCSEKIEAPVGGGA